jgi:hypothetical protein
MSADNKTDPLGRIKSRARYPGMVSPPTGWTQLIIQLDEALAEIVPDYQILQVKEKFGGLRYYVGPIEHDNFEQVHNLIRDAERESYLICEVCGAPGKERDTAWIRTLCDEHAKEV